MADQIRARDLPYGKFLSWRGMVTLEPPRRPEPQRVSSSAAWRSEEWKFGFVGSRDRSSGAVHLPPARVSMKGGALDDMEPAAMADVAGTVVTFTVDRMAYSPSPPVVFAVVDFDGGGRFPVELTDVDAEELAIGDRVEMTFRRLFSADGIHDYFWKGRPVPSIAPDEGSSETGGAPGRSLMASHGIRDRVAIVAMGCTPFGEHWDKGLDDLIIERERGDVRRGGDHQGRSRRLLDRHRAERHERDHARPSPAAPGQAGDPGGELLHDGLGGAARRRLRGGVGRLRRGHGGRRGEGKGRRLPGPQRRRPPRRRHRPHAHRRGHVLHGGARVRAKYGVPEEQMADVLATISAKNHYNGARNPRAQFRREVSKETICASPRVAGRLGVFDCAGVADGAAAAIVVRAEDATRYTDRPLYLKALAFAAGSGSGLIDPDYDYTHFPECEAAAEDAYAAGRHHRPPPRSWPWPRSTTASRRPSSS